MSYTFDMDDVTVWSPANQVGALYVGMLQTVADEMRTRTGLTTDSGDWFQVDRAAYTGLVEKMLAAYAASSHFEFRLLLGSLLAVSIPLLDRAGVVLTARTAEEEAAISQLRDTVL